PLTAVMLLWINMVTDGAPALAFSVDNYGKDAMLRRPKPVGEGILPQSKLKLIGSLGLAGTFIALVLFSFYGGNSANEEEVVLARTMVFNFVVLYEVILVFVIRYGYQVPFFSNPYIWLSVLLSIALQAMIMYTPLHFYFKVVPLAGEELIVLFAAAFGFYLTFLVYHRFFTKSSSS
ncbi:MAG: cation transporting ATPase C-terminal domain-containing protein, partial [Desulfobulbaceae bacterium]|nr:cation transporting ATPase C-terminal domain-containing protein [Desulfobulbaceae bacterium]